MKGESHQEMEVVLIIIFLTPRDTIYKHLIINNSTSSQKPQIIYEIPMYMHITSGDNLSGTGVDVVLAKLEKYCPLAYISTVSD